MKTVKSIAALSAAVLIGSATAVSAAESAGTYAYASAPVILGEVVVAATPANAPTTIEQVVVVAERPASLKTPASRTATPAAKSRAELPIKRPTVDITLIGAGEVTPPTLSL